IAARPRLTPPRGFVRRPGVEPPLIRGLDCTRIVPKSSGIERPIPEPPVRHSGKGAAVNNQWFSKVAVWLVIALVLFTVFKQFDRGATAGNQIGYSDFLEEVRGKRIRSVTLQVSPGGGTEINAVTSDDKRL